MIGIFDSGVGGLSVYREVRKTLPKAGIWYFGDTANCPYGPKTQEFIIARAEAITEMMLKNVDIIVVACNTATAAAISHLREKYSDKNNPEVRKRVLELSGGKRDHIMFIGMEPAVKPAVAATKSRVIGVLATEGTLKGQKYHDMKDLYKGDVKVVENVGEGFVELVEKWDIDSDYAENTVLESVRPLMNAGADTIVLGCTHYPFLTELIEKASKTAAPERNVTIINPAPAVARHLAEVMKEENIPSADQEQTLLHTASGDAAVIKQIAARIEKSFACQYNAQ